MVDHKAEDRKADAEEKKAKTGPRQSAPDFYNEKLDPNNAGRDDLDAQHYAMFNGVVSLDADPGRSIDSGIRPRVARELSDVEVQLARTTTSAGAQGNAIAAAPDTPEKNAVPAEIPVSPPAQTEGPQAAAARLNANKETERAGAEATKQAKK